MSQREAVQAALSSGRPERAWDLCARSWQQGAAQTRHSARRLLIAIAPELPAAAWTEDRKQLAKALGLQAAAPVARVGRMSFPAVGQGEGRFITAVVEAAPAGDRVPPGLDPSVHEALEAAREGGQSFALSFLPADADWEGASCGLAVALAARSLARNLPISPLHSATGRVNRQGTVLPVGLVPEKLRLRHEARPWGRLLIPAAEDGGELPAFVQCVTTLDQAWQALGHLAERDPEPVLIELRKRHRQDPTGAARLALDLVEDPDLEDDERLFLHIVLLAAANHEADAEGQARWGRALSQLVEAGASGEDLARALGSLAVQSIDALDPQAARRALALAEGRVEHEHRIHLDGPAALLATLEGQFELALGFRRGNLARAEPAERARCLGDLADGLRRLGRLEEALEAVDRGLALRSTRAQPYQARTRPYLHLHRARILAELGLPWEEDLAWAEAAPGLDPAVRARLLRAELTGDRAAILGEKDWGILAALKQRSLATLGDQPAQSWLLDQLGGADWQEAARRLPY